MNDKKNFNLQLGETQKSTGKSADLFSGLVSGLSGDNQSSDSSSQETYTPQMDFEEMAKNSYGDLEISKHLYENGLQNIFNDYQKNIERLSEQEKESVQDAYYMKEMSEKYLGQYASNLGVGDVSGELVDIYGNYQKNLQDIKQHYGELEFGLEQTYQKERQEIVANIMQNQYNIEVAQLSDAANQILFNAINGNTEGQDPFSYLNSHRDELGEANYRAAYSTLYEQTFEEISTNIQQGFYGYTTNENGERVRETDPEKYLNQYKGVLNDSDYNMLLGSTQDPAFQEMVSDITLGDFGDYENGFAYIEAQKDRLTPQQYTTLYSGLRDRVINEMETRMSVASETGAYGYTGEGEDRAPMKAEQYMAQLDEQYGDYLENDWQYNYYKEMIELGKYTQDNSANAQYHSVSSKYTLDPETGERIENPHYDSDLTVGEQALFSKENISSNSNVYEIEGVGSKFVQVEDPIDYDETGMELHPELASLDGTTLTNYFVEENGRPPSNGNFLKHSSGFYFIRENNNWYRLTDYEQGAMPTEIEMATWRTGFEGETNVEISKRGPARDVLTVNGQEYITDNKSKKDWEEIPSELRHLFVRAHGYKASDGTNKIKNDNEGRVVYYEGKFYYYKRGKIWEFKER